MIHKLLRMICIWARTYCSPTNTRHYYYWTVIIFCRPVIIFEKEILFKELRLLFLSIILKHQITAIQLGHFLWIFCYSWNNNWWWFLDNVLPSNESKHQSGKKEKSQDSFLFHFVFLFFFWTMTAVKTVCNGVYFL